MIVSQYHLDTLGSFDKAFGLEQTYNVLHYAESVLKEFGIVSLSYELQCEIVDDTKEKTYEILDWVFRCINKDADYDVFYRRGYKFKRMVIKRKK